jgi:signal transduction histidine kinase
MTISPVLSATGKPIALTGVITDMTQEKKMEAELLNAEKMITIGKLAAGVAHEINNPLTALTNDLEKLKSQMPGTEDTRARFERMEHVIDRITNIVSHLLTYSRQKPSVSRQYADIHEILRQSLLLAEVNNKKGIGVTKKLDPKMPLIRLDALRIEQVFLNMIINAFEATPVKGRLAIRTRYSPRKKMVDIYFQDNGVGIESKDMARIFDPFFTTKDDALRVGLGLSISQGIIVSHGGEITFSQNKKGPGTTFRISLPAADIAAARKRKKLA